MLRFHEFHLRGVSRSSTGRSVDDFPFEVANSVGLKEEKVTFRREEANRDELFSLWRRTLGFYPRTKAFGNFVLGVFGIPLGLK